MIANFHAQAIQAMKGGQLGAIYARNPAKAKALGEKYNCKAYHNLADLLADKTIDVVTIATPSGAHLTLLSQLPKRVNMLFVKNHLK